MINLSFNQGVFPNMLKIAHAIHIHKNSDKLDCNNCRFIFLFSNINKIYEKSEKINSYYVINSASEIDTLLVILSLV